MPRKSRFDAGRLIDLFYTNGTLEEVAASVRMTPRGLMEAWRRLQKQGSLPFGRPSNVIDAPFVPEPKVVEAEPERHDGQSVDHLDGRPLVTSKVDDPHEEEAEDSLLVKLYVVHKSPIGTAEYRS